MPSVEASFLGEQAVLAVHETGDLTGARMLGALLAAVMASGCRSVVLDLGELRLVGPAITQVVTLAAGSLVALGGDLTIRPPSTSVFRTLDVSWLGAIVRLDLVEPGRREDAWQYGPSSR